MQQLRVRPTIGKGEKKENKRIKTIVVLLPTYVGKRLARMLFRRDRVERRFEECKIEELIHSYIQEKKGTPGRGDILKGRQNQKYR